MINGLFVTTSNDDVASAFAEKSELAIKTMPEELRTLPTTNVLFRPAGVMGIEGLKDVYCREFNANVQVRKEVLEIKSKEAFKKLMPWSDLLAELEADGNGVIMTMGKGGVGKTSMAAMIATQLAQKGHSVLLSTTDPAAHLTQALKSDIGEEVPNLQIERIDPKVEVENYVCSVIKKNAGKISLEDMALLEEELRSPCIEEIAVFQAFAKTVAKGDKQFIVLDTAPTGHTLLLLDSTEAYHREVAKSADDLPCEVKELLPRIRDPKFTKILIVALPEATPTHEAKALQKDLRRANIEPYGWIINRSFAASNTNDPILISKGLYELKYIEEITNTLSKRTVLSPWVSDELVGTDSLKKLMK